jgi:hypothetical protein
MSSMISYEKCIEIHHLRIDRATQDKKNFDVQFEIDIGQWLRGLDSNSVLPTSSCR